MSYTLWVHVAGTTAWFNSETRDGINAMFHATLAAHPTGPLTLEIVRNVPVPTSLRRYQRALDGVTIRDVTIPKHT